MANNKSGIEYHSFQRNIRLLRQEKSLSAKEAADLVGLRNSKRFGDLEEGRMPPHVDEIMKIAEFFKVKIDTIIYKTATITFI